MSNIQANGEVPEEEEEEVVKQGATKRAKADKVVIEVPGLEIATTRIPRKWLPFLK